MQTKIGIPRSLMYYYPLWKEFFTILGAEVVISPETNKQILNDGIMSSVDECCLPVKLFNGHVINLKDRVDLLFIPKIMSVHKHQFVCPKFFGLPEMVKCGIEDLPPIISPVINFSKSRKDLKKVVHETGGDLTKDKKLIDKAFEKALQSYKKYRLQIKKGRLPVDILDNKVVTINQVQNTVPYFNGKTVKPLILLLGHPYVIYDKYISMDIISKIRKLGMDVITSDIWEYSKVHQKADTQEKYMNWAVGRKMLGSAMYCIENCKGIVVRFCCIKKFK